MTHQSGEPKTVTFEHSNTLFFLSKRRTIASPLHNHTFFEMELVLSGEGETVRNGTTYPLHRGTAYITLPTDTHAIFTTQELSIWHIAFMGNALPSTLINRLIYSPGDHITQLDEATLHDVCTLYERILREQQSPCTDSETIAARCLETFFLLILRQMAVPPSKESGEHSILDAIHFIHQHFRESISQTDVARHVGLTPSYFSARFREKVGCGYKEYLTRLRISYARKQMSFSNLSATELCYESGFNSYSSFFKAFTRTFGISPGKYTEQIHCSDTEKEIPV